jgi:transposase
MQTVTTVGLDIAKSVFQVHGVDAIGQAVIRRQLKRRYVLTFFKSYRRAWSGSRPGPRRIIGRANSRRLAVFRRGVPAPIDVVSI